MIDRCARAAYFQMRIQGLIRLTLLSSPIAVVHQRVWPSVLHVWDMFLSEGITNTKTDIN